MLERVNSSTPHIIQQENKNKTTTTAKLYQQNLPKSVKLFFSINFLNYNKIYSQNKQLTAPEYVWPALLF